MLDSTSHYQTNSIFTLEQSANLAQLAGKLQETIDSLGNNQEAGEQVSGVEL
jgi:hypothetical protein